MLKILIALLGFEYIFASKVVQFGIEKTQIALPEEVKNALIDRVHRMRLDARVLSQFLWFAILIVGFPLQFKVWGLQIALFIERFLNPIFEFLAFCQGFMEGTLFGVLIAIAFWIAINWFENQKAKFYIFYLLYRCGAIE